VTLSRPVLSEEGQVPAGATGTVVHVWSSGTVCEVEFTKPFQAIATVKADDVTV
jgi:molybdopterin-binding protein